MSGIQKFVGLIFCEKVHNDVPWRNEIVSSSVTLGAKDCDVKLSSKPGLGIKIDEDAVKKIRLNRKFCDALFNLMALWDTGKTIVLINTRCRSLVIRHYKS